MTDLHAGAAPPPPEPGDTDAKPSKYGIKAVFGAAVGYAMDGFDLLIIGFALAAITATFHLSDTQAGALSTFTLVGAVAGGVIFGIMSDYLGRVRVLTWSILIFAVFTGLSAAAWNYPSLLTFRFLAGVGLGGEFGIGMTLAAEAWPAKMRARATAWVANGWQAGTLLASVAAAVLIPLGGWRLLFVVGIFPAIVAYFLRRKLHEPDKFTEAKKRRAKTEFPVRKLFADARTTRATIGLLILTSVQNFVYYGVITWMPTYLSREVGESFNKSVGWTAVTVVGMIIGVFVFGKLCDTIGRRPSFFIFEVGAIIAVIVYANLHSSIALLFGGLFLGAFINGAMGGFGALLAELYPTEARATAQNVLWNIGRGVAGFAPLIIAAVAAAKGFPYAIGALAGVYVLAMFALLLIPERKGSELT
jgi:benzoate transport